MTDAASPPGAAALEHIIVVMLENRSFDHLVGYVKHSDPAFDGLAIDRTIPRDPADPSKGTVTTSRRRNVRLRVDPDHSPSAIAVQLGLDRGDTPTNDGFVKSYEEKATGEGHGPAQAARARQVSGLGVAGLAVGASVSFVLGAFPLGVCLGVAAGGGAYLRHRFIAPPDNFPGDGDRIMWCWDPKKPSAISTLALEFALCTRWFCSVPGETWPNRQFAHAGTSAGTVEIELKAYNDQTIFQRLDEYLQGRPPEKIWRIYFDGPPQVLCYPALWKNKECLARWHSMQDLWRDIEADDLPAYTFVESNHGYIGEAYSQHPSNNRRTNGDFRRADRFVAAIYEALRKKPELFAKTLLVITWDEHGGTYDHVAPTKTVAPDGRRPKGFDFDFDRTGVRVPTILVSPWVEPQRVDPTEYDHSSIPATVRAHFVPTAPHLRDRDKLANTFLGSLIRTTRRTGTDLPNLARRARRPRPAFFPIRKVLGLFADREGPLDEGLARLAALVDTVLPATPTDQALDEALPAALGADSDIFDALPAPAAPQDAARAEQKLAENASFSRQRIVT